MYYNDGIKIPSEYFQKCKAKFFLTLESLVAIKIPIKNTSQNEKQNFIVY